jgi:hypothetical protein
VKRRDRNVKSPRGRGAAIAPPSVRVPELYLVIVECRGETEQESLYRRLKAEGFRCRLQTM